MADDDATNGMSTGTATLTPPAPADRKEDTPQHRRRLHRNGVLFLLGIIVAMALAVVCALTWNDVRADARSSADREMFLQAGRQGALNLTTIRWDNVDSDVQRILDGSTGAFHDDFASRAESFNVLVKQAQSTSEGTITEAGLETVTGDMATVLVAATVKTSNTGAAEQDPRAWRMKVTVQKDGDRALVSNVEFVP